MFNFFYELGCEYGLENSSINLFNLVNMSNKLVYIEGLDKVVSINNNSIVVKVKKGVISILGENLSIKRITDSTIVVVGTVKQIESST